MSADFSNSASSENASKNLRYARCAFVIEVPCVYRSATRALAAIEVR